MSSRSKRSTSSGAMRHSVSSRAGGSRAGAIVVIRVSLVERGGGTTPGRAPIVGGKPRHRYATSILNACTAPPGLAPVHQLLNGHGGHARQRRLRQWIPQHVAHATTTTAT